MRHQQNGAKPPNSAQTGWFPWNAQQLIALEPPRLLGLFWNFMASQAPLLTQEGSFKRATVNCFTPSVGACFSWNGGNIGGHRAPLQLGLLFLGRTPLKACGFGKLFQTHNFFGAFSINDPRWIAFDASRPAFARLGGALTVRAALDVRQPVSGRSKDLLLLLAMRTPESSIHFCAASGQVEGEGTCRWIFRSGRRSQYADIVKMKNNDDSSGYRHRLSQPARPRKIAKRGGSLIRH